MFTTAKFCLSAIRVFTYSVENKRTSYVPILVTFQLSKNFSQVEDNSYFTFYNSVHPQKHENVTKPKIVTNVGYCL